MSYSKDKKEFKALFASMEATAQLFAGVGEYASSTEIGGMMSNLVIGTRRLESRLAELEKRQKETLLNITPFDLKEAKKIVHDLEYQVDEALSIDISEKPEEKQIDWEEVIKEENTSLGFALSDSNEEFERVRWFLMKNIRENYKKFRYLCKDINQHLDYIGKHFKETEKDRELSGDIYNQMLNRYLQTEWQLERSSLISSVKKSVAEEKKSNFDEKHTLRNELGQLRSAFVHGNPSTAQRILYRTVIAATNPIKVIVEYRDELTEDDLINYFTFHFGFNMLRAHYNTLPLLEPLTGEYAKLFTCKPAHNYVNIMLPIIDVYVELEELAHYGILMMVLADLDLVVMKNKPYKLMKKYFTANLPNQKILQNSDQEMIRITVSNANGKKFCELERGEVEGTDYKPSTINKYQDIYWRCFTLLSQGGQILPKNIQLATYLTQPHPKIHLSNIMDCLENRHRYWVDFYRSVLRGETLMFPPNF